LTYTIGIDVGTSYTAAAVSRREEEAFADPEPVVLGTRSMATASVVFVGDDGRLLVGDAAERRALSQPERVIREFKRRLGDSVPLIVGEWNHQPEDLAAIMVKWVVDRVADREGGPAAAIGVTHPASWGPYKLALFRQALAHVGLQDVTLLSEPVAAAAHYAAHARIEPGSTVAVYDLGGGTFDAAVVRKTDEHTFELLGRPEGIERLGGVDFDEAVFGHIKDGADLPPLDLADQDMLAALARLRRECTDAKEALSADTETTIPVLLPQKQTRVRLVRSEFEGMVRDELQETVAALRQTVASAGVDDDQLNSVLLVGGSSRIPLIAQLISAEFGRPVAIDADPKATIALGAARAAAATIPVPAGPATEETPGEEAASVGAAALAGADSPDGDEAAVHHPYEQLLQLRAGAPREASPSAFGRIPAAAVAALIAIVISAAAALAWNSTVDSSAPEAQAVEESPSAETTSAAPLEDKMSTSGVSSTDGRTTDAASAEAGDKPLKATKASQGVLGGRDTSSPTPTKKSSSSESPSATSTSPSPSTSSTTSSPAPSPTTNTPEPTPSTSSPPPPPPPPDPDPTPTTTSPVPEPTSPPPTTEPAPEPTGTGTTAP
jgi:molecular chaperone DnaK